MNKPQGYDEAQSYTGDFEQLELGGHVCRITGVKLEYTQNTNAEVLEQYKKLEKVLKYQKISCLNKKNKMIILVQTITTA